MPTRPVSICFTMLESTPTITKARPKSLAAPAKFEYRELGAFNENPAKNTTNPIIDKNIAVNFKMKLFF